MPAPRASGGSAEIFRNPAAFIIAAISRDVYARPPPVTATMWTEKKTGPGGGGFPSARRDTRAPTTPPALPSPPLPKDLPRDPQRRLRVEDRDLRARAGVGERDGVRPRSAAEVQDAIPPPEQDPPGNDRRPLAGDFLHPPEDRKSVV